MTDKELREQLLDIVSEARLDPADKYDDTFVDQILALFTSDKLALLDRVEKEVLNVGGHGLINLRQEQHKALTKLRAEQKETDGMSASADPNETAGQSVSQQWPYIDEKRLYEVKGRLNSIVQSAAMFGATAGHGNYTAFSGVGFADNLDELIVMRIKQALVTDLTNTSPEAKTEGTPSRPNQSRKEE